MPHPLRWYLPDVVYEITTRTIQERFLMRPSDESRELILGVIARAMVFYRTVKVYAFVFLSNHYHTLASASDPEELAMFVGYVNSNIAREMGRLHGWSGPFWARRARPIPVLDPAAQIARLRYIMSNGVKEGLVASPRDWPGASSVSGLLGTMNMGGVWVDRDGLRRAVFKDPAANPAPFIAQMQLTLSPVPAWAHLDEDELRAKYEAVVADVEREAIAKAIPILGARKAIAVHPHSRPSESSRRRAPLCHTTVPALRDKFRAAYAAFVRAFREIADNARRILNETPTFAFPGGSSPRPRWFSRQTGPALLSELFEDI